MGDVVRSSAKQSIIDRRLWRIDCGNRELVAERLDLGLHDLGFGGRQARAQVLGGLVGEPFSSGDADS